MLKKQEIQKMQALLAEAEVQKTIITLRANQLADALEGEISEVKMMYIADCATRLNDACNEHRLLTDKLNEICYHLACETCSYTREFESIITEWKPKAVAEENTTEVPANEPV